MSDKSRVDPEQLAALLEGKLSARERDELLSRIDRNDEAFEVLVDAAAILQETEPASDAKIAGRVIRPRTYRAGWLAVAAGVAGIALLPWAWRHMRGSSEETVAGYAEWIDAGKRTLPPGWDTRAWAATRGSEAGLSPNAQAVRLGVVVADLEVAAGASDASVVRLASQGAELAEAMVGGAPVASLYRTAAATPSQARPMLREARQSLALLPARDAIDAAAFVETARLAAMTNDSSFFRDPRIDGALDRVQRSVAGNAEARSALARLRASIGGSSQAVQRATNELIGAMAK